MAKTSSATQQPFLTDIKTLRARARKHIEDGAVTAGYQADRVVVIKLLNEALATELVCILRYKRHYFMPAASMPIRWRRNSSSTPPKSRAMPT